MRIPVHLRTGASGRVQVYCPDLAGCSAAAGTQDEALQLLRARIRDYFESSGAPLPPHTRRMEIEI